MINRWEFKKCKRQPEGEDVEETQCPSRAANKAAHKQFLVQFAEFQERFQKDGATTTLVLELKDLASSWLKSHICKIDTGLRACGAVCRG